MRNGCFLQRNKLHLATGILTTTPNGIRHIEIENFTNDFLLDDFYNAVTGAEKAGMKGIDINVRGNPGGRLDYVTAMLQMLVPRGLILKQVMRDPGSSNLTQIDTTMADGYAIIATKNFAPTRW